MTVMVQKKFLESQEMEPQVANAILDVFDFASQPGESVWATGIRFQRLLECSGGAAHARHG